MNTKYDLVGLWFQIYQSVVRYNESLGEEGLDKSQLREITTSIFIASTQRGIVRPLQNSRFLESVMRLVYNITDRERQTAIYKLLSDHLKAEASGNGAV